MPALRSASRPVEIRRVLLLDDDELFADSLKHLLEMESYLVTTVADGVAGVREIVAMDFDVIICDVLMPKMGGNAFFLAVESAKPHLIERFIFITGHRDNRSVENFVNRVPAPVLQKPIQIDDLADTIRSVLRKTRRRR